MEFVWQAKYRDGDTFSGKYGDIDRSCLTSFSIIEKGGGSPILTISLLPEQKLFYRKRTFVSFLGDTEIVHICGWTQDDQKFIYVIHGDGKIETGLGFDLKDKYFAPIVFGKSEL